jgi:hypothetical protein
VGGRQLQGQGQSQGQRSSAFAAWRQRLELLRQQEARLLQYLQREEQRQGGQQEGEGGQQEGQGG